MKLPDPTGDSRITVAVLSPLETLQYLRSRELAGFNEFMLAVNEELSVLPLATIVTFK